MVRIGKIGARRTERGQTLIMVALALGLFLLATLGIGVDLANVWFHRQSVQSAADASCVAGAMDMLTIANGGMTSSLWSAKTADGTIIDCTSTSPNTGKSDPSPCWYASKNGYTSPGLSTGGTNSVLLTFLSDGASWGAKTVPGVSGFSLAGAAPFLQVKIVDRVPVYFLSLVGPNTVDVPAISGCGLQLAKAPIPLVILDPTNVGTMSSNGNASLQIIGGPSQSVEVNSTSATAVTGQFSKTTSYGGTIDLTMGGPDYSGSSFGVAKGPLSAPSGFSTNSPGQWTRAAIVSDPFSTYPAPTPLPAAPTDPLGACTSSAIQQGSCGVGSHDSVNNCPDSKGCTLYTAGLYPNGIEVKSGTAVFAPGIYYLQSSLILDANSVVRMSNAVGDNSGGVMFYITGTPPKTGSCKAMICVDSNSGKAAGGHTIDTFDIYAAQCPSGTPIEAKLIAKLTTIGATYSGLTGNLLLGQCSQGTVSSYNYGDPSGNGKARGMLFFLDHSVTGSNAQGSWNGGGQSLLAGNVYFHDNDNDATFTLQGNACSSSYILGEIVTDRLDFGGTPCIKMVLNPDASYNILKAALLH